MKILLHSKNSSTTTVAEAVTEFFINHHFFKTAKASSKVNATVTPLPAASPSALITIGAPFSLT